MDYKITTQDNFADYDVTETLGIVTGNTVRTRGFGHDFVAGLKNLVGGEIDSYRDMLDKARDLAIERMVEDAKMLGADGVVCMRISTSEIMQGAAEIMAYGTAVKLSKK
ncbi:MAG TPA: YbjQ family protein [Caldisericia bacterium]|nr:YbjQ family protein [Caldisericia bacterium]HPF48719.1 YbjQ family protein [Caldisericia bacterium]HPI83621.1 YbjQ family protein [Caldisericia bacterium]HPQ93174.1 YbjQ family protein [Caldisericia bacterium]HRV74993.1 YbjQ family protein [Caldisericia bacterium]